jgi:hypothetical protein
MCHVADHNAVGTSCAEMTLEINPPYSIISVNKEECELTVQTQFIYKQQSTARFGYK